VIGLTALDLAAAVSLVLGAAGLSAALGLGVARSLLVAALRTGLQLLLVGLVLELLFDHGTPIVVGAWASLMLLVAAHEVRARQGRGLAGHWGWTTAGSAMLVSAFSVAAFTLILILGAEPWHTPRYAVPLLGLLLGNTMTGVALSLERLTQGAFEQREMIEARLLLGKRGREAIADLRRASVRAGLIPTINAMAAVGVVSLPGIMTGQILAGVAPLEAVRYQIVVMFLIAATTTLGTATATHLAAQRLFDARERLRLDRLLAPRAGR
jgi:putative ABC transport system permease protein